MRRRVLLIGILAVIVIVAVGASRLPCRWVACPELSECGLQEPGPRTPEANLTPSPVEAR
jgi:hypothetical protein